MSPLTPNPSTFYHCCYGCLRWQGCSPYHRYRIYLYMLNHGHWFIRGTEQPFAQGKCANFTQSGLGNGTCNLTLHRSAKRWTTVSPLVDFQIKNLDFSGVVSDGFPKLAHLRAWWKSTWKRFSLELGRMDAWDLINDPWAIQLLLHALHFTWKQVCLEQRC